MKKLFTYLLLISVMGFSACSYDDTSLWEKVNNHENRISELEEMCKKMNSNISAMQTILNAMEENNYITSVTPVVENGETIGYTIAFTKSEPITIYHGKDGKDGANGENGTNGIDGTSPVIRIQMGNDGIYYWTLNGEWLLDAEGNRIVAVGVDGITPLLKIENDYWHISYDNGATWTELGKAKGEDGRNYCDFFQDITEDDDYVYFTLADESVIAVLKDKPFALQLDVDRISYTAGTTYNVGFTVTGATEDTTMEVIPSNNLRAYVSDYKVEDGVATGYVTVEMPKAILEYATVAVIVSDGRSKVLMKAIHFDYADGAIEEGIIYITNGEAFNFPKEGGELEVNLQTNISYRVELEERTAEWLSVGGTRSTLREESLMLYAGENTGEFRHGFVYLVDISNNHIVEIIYVSQNSDEVYYEEVILFADTTFESYMISSFDLDKNGVVTKGEALSAETVIIPKDVANLTGLEYCVNLKSLSLASNTGVTSLNTSTFPLLEILNLSSSKVATIDLSRNPRLRKLTVNSSALTVLDVAYNNELEYLACPGLQKLTNTTLLLENHPKLTYLDAYNSKLTLLNISGCPELKYLYCHSNALTELYVSKSPKLEEIHMENNSIREIDLSKNTELTIFNCEKNKLTSLDMQACMKLYSFAYNYNPLTNLNMGALPRIKSINMTVYTSLVYNISISGEVIENISIGQHDSASSDGLTVKSLYCNTPKLKTLNIEHYTGDEIDFGMVPSVESISISYASNLYDISYNNPNLKSFSINECNKMSEIVLPQCPNLESVSINNCDKLSNYSDINFSGNQRLQSISVYNCEYLTDVDFSGYPELQSVSISANDRLEGANITNNPKLQNASISNQSVLKGANLSNNLELQSISASGCSNLTGINLSGSTKLQSVTVSSCNNLAEIDFSDNPELQSVSFTNTGLTTLDLSNNLKVNSIILNNVKTLTYLNLGYNTILTTFAPFSHDTDSTDRKTTNGSSNFTLVAPLLKSLTLEECGGFVDITGCPELTTLTFIPDGSTNSMTTFDLSKQTKLKKLTMNYMTSLTGLDLSHMSELTTLSINNCSALQSLNINGCAALTSLTCTSNAKLPALDCSGCTSLTTLAGYSNSTLATLDISDCTALTTLNCYSCALETLDLSNNVSLTTLNCYSNLFETLDISNNTAITSMDCSPNDNLTTLYMKEGHTISKINNNRNASNIPAATEILYK